MFGVQGRLLVASACEVLFRLLASVRIAGHDGHQQLLVIAERDL